MLASSSPNYTLPFVVGAKFEIARFRTGTAEAVPYTCRAGFRVVPGRDHDVV